MHAATMLRRAAILFLIAVLFVRTPAAANSNLPVRQEMAAGRTAAAMADELIAAVNALRAEQGLSALAVNPLIMQVAQTQAEYMAATGQITHYSADGKRPFQRALEAGFPVAGDLSLGGFYSENIVAGGNLSPQGAVEMWLGDDPHRNTMFSVNRSHVGAGVAVDGDYVYYVLDTALISNEPVSQTVVVADLPTPGALLAPITISTPAADGSVIHTVRTGETLWSIAAVYGLTVDQLVQINQLSSDQFIHPDDQLIIQPSHTPTASPIPTLKPSATPRPATATMPIEPSATVEVMAATVEPLQEQREDVTDQIVLTGIILASIVVITILWHGFKRAQDSKP
jgi:uncharacterized protein YkwD/LysM repeat protein